MQALAQFIMKGRASAVLAVTLLTVGSWLVSPLSLLAGAALALPTLRQGSREGAVIALMALPAVALGGWLALGTPVPAIYSALVLWCPVWLVSLLLRETGSLATALIGAGVLGGLMVIGLYAVVDDPAQLWIEQFTMLAGPEAGGEDGFGQRLPQISRVARYLTGLMAGGLVLTTTAALFIARWWQATLYNPGGFHGEFLTLRFPPALAYAWLGLLGVAIATRGAGGSELWENLVVPPGLLFVFAGLAVLHHIFSRRERGRTWLALVYLALVFVSPLVAVVLFLGLSDIWADWRTRLAPA
jgi:hypothetical protein